MRSSSFLLLLNLSLAQTPQSTGIKMTVRSTLGGNFSTEQTTYLLSDRKRVEWRGSEGRRNFWGSTTIVYGPHTATITRCDLGKEFMVNLDARQYSAMAYPSNAFAEALAKAKALPRPVPPPPSPTPTLRIETNTFDTGERKQMFGHTARHIVITEKYIPFTASTQMAHESVTNAWHIDLDTRLSCDFKWPAGVGGHWYGISGDTKQEVPEFVDMGEAPKGFSVAQTTRIVSTLKLPDGTSKQVTSQSEIAVVDFQEGTLDPSLFEIPKAFKLVDNVQLNPPQQPPSAWEQFKAHFANLFRG